MRVQPGTTNDDFGSPPTPGPSRFHHRRRVAQLLAGLVVAGMGLPMASGMAEAATHNQTLAGTHSAVGKSSSAKRDKKLSKAEIRAAADGSVAASSYGVKATVSLLGTPLVNTTPTPTSNYPNGPASANTGTVTAGTALSTGAVTTTANGDDLKDTASASASVAGLGTGTALAALQSISADLVQSTCTGTGGGVSGDAKVTGLKLGGTANTTIPGTLPANYNVDVGGLATLTLNEQTTSNTGGKSAITVNALHLKLLNGTADVIAGQSVCSTTNAVTPAVSSFTPTSGPANGGTAVTITGTGFRGTTDVQFGTTSAQYTIDSTTQITAYAPAGTGTAPVKVINAAGTGTSSGTFEYLGVPVVTGINPATGPPGGGTSVVVTGTGFSPSATVKFGNADATVTSRNGTTGITVTAPAGTGSQFVTVTSAGGTSAQTNDAVFSYVGVPTAGSISPGRGSVTGGTSVALTGTNFTNATVVLVDGNDVPTTYVSTTEVDFVTPVHAVGGVPITVRTGTQAGTGSATFTYASPNVTGMTPNSGPITGSTSVTVTGTDLNQVTSVSVGTGTGTITSQNATTIVFTTPVNLTAAGVPVVLNGPGTNTTAAGTFTYNLGINLPPVSLAMNPSTGPIAGGTPITILGVNLGTPTDVQFGGVSGTNFSFSLGTINVTTPQGIAAGDVPVTILYTGGVTQTLLANTFTYTGAAATLGTPTPGSGPTTGGTSVTLTGTGFTPNSVVYIDGVPVLTTYNSSTSLTFSTTIHARGSAPITVVTNGVTASGASFTYASTPLNAVATPLTSSTAGGTSVTVTGTGLADVASVLIGGNTVNTITAQSNTSLTFVTPAHAAGIVTITLQGAFGTSLLPNLFVYTAAAPNITSVNPASGPQDGGYTVTLTGTGFENTLVILVGGLPATNVTVVNSTTVTFRMPAGLQPGPVTILVTTTGGTDTVTFTYGAAATVSSISPISGPAAGGTTVTVTGTGFTGANSVTIGGTVVNNITVVNNTTITFLTPQHSAGTAQVVVNGDGGDSTQVAIFTYLAANLSPTITVMSPGIGTVDGGTQVTIYGTGFLLANSVTFGGVAATNISVVNNTTIIATTPAHAAGSVNVIVTTPVGSSTSVTASQFTYVAANTVPVIDTMTPRSGPTGGGTTVVFRGLGLQTVDQITFDGVAGTNLTILDNTTASVVTPAHAAGGIAVLLRNSQGTSSSYLFTYVPLSGLPTVAGLTPNVGPVAGGTPVTITGTGFDANTTVSFDGVLGTNLVLGADVDTPLVGASKTAKFGAARTRDNDLKAKAYKPMSVSRAVSKWKAAASNTLTVTTPVHVGGPTTVVVTNSAGSMSFVESFTFIPVLAQTVTLATDVTVSSSKAIAPKGPNYSGLEVTACGTPTGLGSTEISTSGKACVYTATDTLGTDSFEMSVIDDLGQTSEQTVNVTVVSADDGGGTGSGNGSGNDSGNGDGSGSGNGSGNDSGNGGGSGSGGGGGNDTGGGLAFTGTPLLLIPGLALGLMLVLIGGGLLGAERFRIRRSGNAVQPRTDEDGRQLMPAGLFGPEVTFQEADDQYSPKPAPDDAA